jgi:hypothetical protein
MENHLRRALEPISTENQRVGSIGPALFAVIFIGVAVLGLCTSAAFVDHTPTRRRLRAAGFILLFIPLVFFSSATYIKDTSQISSTRKFDSTQRVRYVVLIAGLFALICGLISLCNGPSSPLLMHRQGRNVGAVKT